MSRILSLFVMRRAALLGVDVIVHLLGERPGTGIHTQSAYLTYGRDRSGALLSTVGSISK